MSLGLLRWRGMPRLKTDRLRLRPFVLSDLDALIALAGEWEVADTTLNVPHPYTRAFGESWLAGLPEAFVEGRSVVFAVEEETRPSPGPREPAVLRRLVKGRLVGAVALEIQAAHNCAEVGYWVGRAEWGRGVATEAARATVRFGFDVLNLNKMFAYRLTRNLASGRVLEKLGFQREGELRQQVRRWVEFEDIVVYGLLKGEFEPGTENQVMGAECPEARRLALAPAVVDGLPGARDIGVVGASGPWERAMRDEIRARGGRVRVHRILANGSSPNRLSTVVGWLGASDGSRAVARAVRDWVRPGGRLVVAGDRAVERLLDWGYPLAGESGSGTVGWMERSDGD